MRLNLRDASNYYFILRVPTGRLPYQAVGPAVSRAWVKAGMNVPDSTAEVNAVFDDPDQIQGCFTAVCMGDTNGVVVGEEFHLNLALHHGIFEPAEFVVYGDPAPEGNTWAGIYINDSLTAGTDVGF